MSRQTLLALLSGAPALIYQVVWTREVGLLVGGQIEAISWVLVVFFGGLAVGTRWLGPLADGHSRPLRLFALLESVAGVLAIGSSFVLRSMGEGILAGLGPVLALALSCALILPITVLLGGVVPALVRSATADARSLGRISGRLVGANTLGAVLGVAAAVAMIPRLGLRYTLLAGGCLAGSTALLALVMSLGVTLRGTKRGPLGRSALPSSGVLAAAALLGVATLGYEVLASRGAMLRLGSSLYAWALVLGLFLAGLALGNLLASSLAQRSERPRKILAGIEAAAALAVAYGATSLIPALAAPASGLTPASLLGVFAAVFPGALMMGCAFPFLVRLAGAVEGRAAASFSYVTAFNTAGGVLGSLLVPYLLLPAFGFENAALCCALLNAAVAAWLVASTAKTRIRGALGAAGLVAGVGGAGVLLMSGGPPPAGRVLSVEYGRQATSVVLHERSRRTLVVDGDPEAATGGDARVTEELMAMLPMLLHPAPQRLLEVGFGSGITLAAAARFPLETVHCVEIAGSVLRSARFFAPDNDGIGASKDPRVAIVRGDGRAYLAGHPQSYDIIVANTLHPWSLGSTGLYSREYFQRIRRALRAGGIAVQWVAVEPLNQATLSAILRTIASVFPSGSIWWGAENLIVLASDSPMGDPRPLLRARAVDPALSGVLEGLGWSDGAGLSERWIAEFGTVREQLGPGLELEDDRPVLEVLATGRQSQPGEAFALVTRLAASASEADHSLVPLRTWLESRTLRLRGEEQRADRLESEAERAGLALARSARLQRIRLAAQHQLDNGRLKQAQRGFRQVIQQAPGDTAARRGEAEAVFRAGDPWRSRELLNRVVADAPGDALAWNLVGVIEQGRGEPIKAKRAFESALADPFLLEALANAGLVAVSQGDLPGAIRMLERLHDISPLSRSAEERGLAAAIRQARSSSE